MVEGISYRRKRGIEVLERDAVDDGSSWVWSSNACSAGVEKSGIFVSRRYGLQGCFVDLGMKSLKVHTQCQYGSMDGKLVNFLARAGPPLAIADTKTRALVQFCSSQELVANPSRGSGPPVRSSAGSLAPGTLNLITCRSWYIIYDDLQEDEAFPNFSQNEGKVPIDVSCRMGTHRSNIGQRAQRFLNWQNRKQVKANYPGPYLKNYADG